MHATGRALTILGILALAGCAVAPPEGPSIMALPGKDKSFEAFQTDDAVCKQYALAQIGYASPAAAANQSAAGSAAVGTALGAAAGAAIGAATGNPGAGAAIGAGSGLVLGGASGLNAAGASSYALQRRYDIAYIQCMSAKGEDVPAAQAPGAASALQYPYPYTPYYYPYYSPYYYHPYWPYWPYYGSAFLDFGFGFHHHRGFGDGRHFDGRHFGGGHLGHGGFRGGGHGHR